MRLFRCARPDGGGARFPLRREFALEPVRGARVVERRGGGLVGERDGSRRRVHGGEVELHAFPERGAGEVEDGAGDVLVERFDGFGGVLRLEDEAAREQSVLETALRERVVEEMRDARAEQDEVGLLHGRIASGRRAAAPLHGEGAPDEEAVGRTEDAQEDSLQRFRPGVLELDLVEERVDFVHLVEHARTLHERVLEALARTDGVADHVREAELRGDLLVHAPRLLLAGAGVREREDVKVGPRAAGVLELAAGEGRQKRERAGEREDAVGQVGRPHRVGREFVDEAGNPQKRIGDGAGVVRLGFRLRAPRRLHLLEDAREVHARARVGRLAVSLREKVFRGGRGVAAVFEKRVDRERRAVESRRERIGVGREDVEVHAVERRGEGPAVLAGPAPLFVVAVPSQEAPAVSFEEGVEGRLVPVERVARPLVEGRGRRRRGMRRRVRRRGVGELGEGDGGVQKHTALLGGDRRNRSERALDEMIAGAWRTQKEPAFAAGLNERRALLVALSLGELEVAVDGLLATIDHMASAARRPFDDEPAEEVGRDGFRPRLEALAAGVEVQTLEVARHRAGDDAERLVRIGEPRLDLLLGRQAFLVRAPRGEGGVLVRGNRRQDRQPGCEEFPRESNWDVAHFDLRSMVAPSITPLHP